MGTDEDDTQPPSVFTELGVFHHPEFYRRDGTPCSMMEYARLRLIEEYRCVALSRLPNGSTLSTVWTGLKRNIWGDGPPQIFETAMVFREGDTKILARYTTQVDALEGHNRFLDEWMAELAHVKEVTGRGGG